MRRFWVDTLQTYRLEAARSTFRVPLVVDEMFALHISSNESLQNQFNVSTVKCPEAQALKHKSCKMQRAKTV